MNNYFPGAFCDLVWSDPEDVETWAISPRGAGWLFGAKVTHEFMLLNNLKLICRAHQLVHEGMYKLQYVFGIIHDNILNVLCYMLFSKELEIGSHRSGALWFHLP